MMEQVVYSGKLFQVIKRTEKRHFEVLGQRVEKDIQYELVRRPPGVRALLVQNDKILLNREFRYELDRWDYRLPGGKVFDTTKEYVDALKAGNIYVAIENQLKKEVLEEADIRIIDFGLIDISHCGFTVEWDLYYFIVDIFEVLPSFYEKHIKKNEYEYIEHCWMDCPSVYRLCLDGEISEKSSAFVLLKYLLNKYPNKLLDSY